jgi:YidC/Oxa1 family membrane protein insertase
MIEKRTILAIVLSLFVLFVWEQLFPPPEIKPEEVKKTAVEETKEVLPEKKIEEKAPEIKISEKEYIFTVTNGKTERKITNLHGVRFVDYFMLNHLDSAKNPVSLVNFKQDNHFTAQFYSHGELIELDKVHFSPADSLILDYTLNEKKPVVKLDFYSKINERTLRKTLIFEHGVYDYRVEYDFSDLAGFIDRDEITYGWKNGMPYTEEVVYDDQNMSLIFIEGSEDIERFDTSDEEEFQSTLEGYIKNVTVRTKYFMTSVLFDSQDIKKIYADQKVRGQIDDRDVRNYNFHFKTTTKNNAFSIYTGPYDYSELKVEKYEKYDLSNVFMNASGYESLFSFISIPVLQFLIWINSFIGSYGIAIIIFTIVIKILLFPLTKKSYQGMKAMQEMQPKMAKLKEKYGNDPQEMQKQTMRFYKEEGVNPLGGCLPMLFQMPLLLALYQVFRGAIELRGESFLWIENFAAPDALPIGLDAIGFATLNILPILMAVSQIFMSRMQNTDPNQKALVYIMPVMMLVMFYRFSAALNFYYLLFNVFTAVQQHFIHAPEKKKAVKAEETAPKGMKINEKSKSIDLKKPGKQMYKKKDK